MASVLLSAEATGDVLEGLSDANLLELVLCQHVHEARLQEAAQVANDWQQRSPGSSAATGARAWLQWHQGQPEAAAELARTAVGRGEASALAHGVLAMNASGISQWDEALLHAQQAFRESTVHPHLALLLAEVHTKRGELPQAEHAIRRAAQQDRGDCAGRLALAEHLLAHEATPPQVQEAIALATAVVQSHPREATAWALLGLGQTALGNWSQALPYLERAMLLRPHHAGLIIQWVRVVLVSGMKKHLDKAALEAQRVTTMAPGEWAGWLLRYEALRMQGRSDAAILALHAASAYHANQPELWLAMASACAASGQLDAASEALNKARSLPSPNQRQIATLTAEIAFRNGDLATAWTHMAETWEGREGPRRPLEPESARDAGRMKQTIAVHGDSLDTLFVYSRWLPALASLGFVVRLAMPADVGALWRRLPALDAVDVAERIKAHWHEPLTRLPVLLPGMTPVEPPYLKPGDDALARARIQRRAHAGPCLMIDLGPQPDIVLIDALATWQRRHDALVVSNRAIPDGWPGAGRWMALSDVDVEELAAWAMTADAVVSGDVLLSHLVGAMGVPGHVVLAREHAAWWGQSGTSCALYTGLTLWRHSDALSWLGMGEQLQQLLAPAADKGAPK